MRISSAGKVSIGTANTYNAEADNLIIFDSGNAGLTIASSSTSANNTIHFADGTSGDAQYRGVIEYAHNGDSMRFKVSGESEKMRIDGDGTLLLKGGSVTGKQEIVMINGNFTLADDATTTLSGVRNTNCFLVVSSTRSNAGVSYPAAMLFGAYGASQLTKVADPQDKFATADTDGKVCVFISGNSDIIIKNRVGSSANFTVALHRGQGL